VILSQSVIGYGFGPCLVVVCEYVQTDHDHDRKRNFRRSSL